tara:strand:- start:10012 stop:11445 length:1434 start_codon:yes stop_codon:yes gene_type:complete
VRKPNIIFVFADQLRYQSCGFAGDKKARTPNLDMFAADGINLRQAVSSMPVCSAYRASLFTGKYTSSTGMVINELRMNTDHRCLAHCLTDAGYNTGYIGKWHLYANELGNHDNPKNSHIPVGTNRLGFDGYWAAYNFHHTYYGTYYHTNSQEKTFHGSDVFEPDAQTDMAIDFINRYKDDEKPFYLTLSIGTPHDPWTKENVPTDFYRIFKEIEFPPPPNYSDDIDPYGDLWSNENKSIKKLDEWMRVYYAMVANLDWNFGKLVDAIENANISENTIIIFTSDHGEMFGAHGRMKKNIFYEESVRVPFLIQWKNNLPSSHIYDTLISTVDIMPTILGLVGVDIPIEVEGLDLSNSIRGIKQLEPNYAFLMNTGACAIWENGHEWRAIRTKEFTYAVYRGSDKLPRKELFFDNINDSCQMVNIIDQKKYNKIIKKYRAYLKEKMDSINDTFPESTWYLENWISNRKIERTATLNSGVS